MLQRSMNTKNKCQMSAPGTRGKGLHHALLECGVQLPLTPLTLSLSHWMTAH